jgi:glycosyltransferase involved in cell wall biosynthesis
LKIRVGIVIPAYNEEKTIENIVLSSSKYGVVIVVDDGSKDRTAQLARSSGAIVISHSTNKGYDQAIFTGLEKALEIELDFAITFDADGQHNSNEIKTVINKFIQKDSDLILGVRSKVPRFSEYMFNLYVVKRFNVLDILCGLKGYRLEKIKGYLNNIPESSVGTELAFRCLKNRMKIDQVPVTINLRKDNSRYGSIIVANFKIMKALLLLILKFDLFDFLIVK